MIHYLVVIGSVTSKQYEPARRELVKKLEKDGDEVVIFRMSIDEWLLDRALDAYRDLSGHIIDNGPLRLRLLHCHYPLVYGSERLFSVGYVYSEGKWGTGREPKDAIAEWICTHYLEIPGKSTVATVAMTNNLYNLPETRLWLRHMSGLLFIKRFSLKSA